MPDLPVVSAIDVNREFQVGSEVVHAVRDASLEVHRGEFVALIGRSGSGKTTLLNIIAGLDKPTSGIVKIDGEDITKYNERQLTNLRRHKIGFVFQSFGLLPLLSAAENVEIALRIAGAGLRARRRRTDELMPARPRPRVQRLRVAAGEHRLVLGRRECHLVDRIN